MGDEINYIIGRCDTAFRIAALDLNKALTSLAIKLKRS
jgi:hypothetical protein